MTTVDWQAPLEIVHPARPAFSPDGTMIACAVEAAYTLPGAAAQSHIWIAAADGSGARQASRGPRGRHGTACGRPTGASLAFLSDRDQPRQSALHLLDDGVGEARRLGDVPGSVEQVRFARDGRTVIALAADPGSDRAGADSATRIGENGADDPRRAAGGRALAPALPHRHGHRRDDPDRPGRRERVGVRLARRRARGDRLGRPVRERLVCRPRGARRRRPRHGARSARAGGSDRGPGALARREPGRVRRGLLLRPRPAGGRGDRCLDGRRHRRDDAGTGPRRRQPGMARRAVAVVRRAARAGIDLRHDRRRGRRHDRLGGRRVAPVGVDAVPLGCAGRTPAGGRLHRLGHARPSCACSTPPRRRRPGAR